MQVETQEPQEAFPPPGWLTKTSASERLNRSPSRVAALGVEGAIKTQTAQNPVSKQRVTLFHAGDVERLVYERDHPEEVSRVPAKLEQPSDAFSDLAKTGMWSLRGLPRLERAELPTLKPWLTLAEAAEYSGLPVSTIRNLIDASRLPHLDVGPRPGGRWRVKRSDLDALEGHQ
jgi:excisionase family DNA binding protein